jgi:hypothetical protein
MRRFVLMAAPRLIGRKRPELYIGRKLFGLCDVCERRLAVLLRSVMCGSEW